MNKQAAYELGVRLALEEAGLVKTAFDDSTRKGFGYGMLAGGGASLAAIIAELASKGKINLPALTRNVYAPALLAGGLGAGIGALAD